MQVALPCACLPAHQGCRPCPALCLLTAALPRSCLLSAKPRGQVQLWQNPHVGGTRAEPAGLATGALPAQNMFRSNRDLRDALGHFCTAQGAWLAKKLLTLVLGLSRTHPQCSAWGSVGIVAAARCSPTWEFPIWLCGAQLC